MLHTGTNGVPPPGAIAVPNSVRWYVWITLSAPESSQHSSMPVPLSRLWAASVSSAGHSARMGTTVLSVLFT